ncbi:hypothetical protein F3129_16100 [Bacillus velezensis]|nr:hypothetical protein F3129_16100 [Bacillus velezensis]
MIGQIQYIFRTQPFFFYFTRFYLKFLITCSRGTFFAFNYIFSEKRKSLFSLKTGFFARCVICFMTRCSVYAF